MEYFGLKHISIFWKTIQQHGGIRKSLYKLYRMDSLRPGCLMGIDKNGNKYYENRAYFMGRSRWVEYNDYYNMDYDGSQVAAEWYGWLHYKTDLIPDEDPSRPCYPWMSDHPENPTGTRDAYYPYSTGIQKIQVWRPPGEIPKDPCK